MGGLSSFTMSVSISMKQGQVDKRNSKRPLCEKVGDRLSSLPFELKLNLISHLPFRDAVRTCVLSKSWKHVFSSLPILAFFQNHFTHVPNSADQFTAFIEWTLSNRDNSAISALAVHCNILEQNCLTLKNMWVNFAVEHNVQHLQLIAKIDETGLPSCLFTCKTLVSFKLMAKSQLLKLPSVTHLPNLKEMWLGNVNFPDDSLTEALFEGCPQLVFLYIEKCGMLSLTKLRISCPKLHTLWISNCTRMDMCIINLEGTSIEYFYYDGCLAQSFEFGTMNRLSGVELNITRSSADGRNDSGLAQVAWNILSQSAHAGELILSALFIKVLMEVRDELWKLSYFTNLTNVRLYVWPSLENEEIVMSLLGKFPRVQTLEMIVHASRRVWPSLTFRNAPGKV